MAFKDPRHKVIYKTGFTKYLPEVASNISPTAAIYLAELLSSDSYRLQQKVENNRKYDGSFFHGRNEIEERTGLSETYQRNAQKELEAHNIITVQRKGIPCRNHFIINYDELDKFLLSHKANKNSQNGQQQETSVNSSKLSAEITASREPGQQQDIMQDDDINNNKEIIIKNNNKVSKGTYFSKETDAYDLKTTTSCIHKKELAKKPQISAPNFEQDFEEATDIIQKYNFAMNLEFDSKEKEYENVFEHLELLKSMKKYFKPHILQKVWTDYGDDYTREYKSKRISGFIKCKLLEQMSKNIKFLTAVNTTEIDTLLDKIFRRHSDIVKGAADSLGYEYKYGNLEPRDASIHFPPKKHREERLNIYNKHLKELLTEDEKNDMMILEV